MLFWGAGYFDGYGIIRDIMQMHPQGVDAKMENGLYKQKHELTSAVENLSHGGGNSNIFGIFTPILGEMIQFDEHIFQMGWFNHQLVAVFFFVFLV